MNVIVKSRFAGVVIVCADCEERSSGPSKLKSKSLRKQFKRDLQPLRIRMRIVESGCLGMCPKKAIAVVAMANERPICAAELQSKDDVGVVVEALRPLSAA